MNTWTIEKLKNVLRTHSNPSTLDGFVRKEYVGKGAADLRVEEGAREFVSYITTDIRDRDNEIVDPAGIDFSEYKKNPVILWGHNYAEPAIGRALWIKRWSEGKRVRGHIAKGVIAGGVQKADEIFRLMQQQILNTVSIGFIPLTGHAPTEEEIKSDRNLRGVRWIHDKVAMLEYSIVNVPSNPQATIEAVSKGLLKISDSLQNELGLYIPANTIMKKAVEYKATPMDGIEAGWVLSEETRDATPEQLMEMAGWADFSHLDRKSSYKYIHHRNQASFPLVWNGLTESMSKLNTFSYSIPEEDRADVYRHLARHYRDFGKEPPELAGKAIDIPIARIEPAVVDTKDAIQARQPVEVYAIPTQEVIEARRIITPEEVAEKTIETFEIKVLGRV